MHGVPPHLFWVLWNFPLSIFQQSANKETDWEPYQWPSSLVSLWLIEWNPIPAACRFQILMKSFLRDFEPVSLWILYFVWFTSLPKSVKLVVISKESRSCWKTDWHDRLTVRSQNMNISSIISMRGFFFKNPAHLLISVQLHLPNRPNIYYNKNETKNYITITIIDTGYIWCIYYYSFHSVVKTGNMFITWYKKNPHSVKNMTCSAFVFSLTRHQHSC